MVLANTDTCILSKQLFHRAWGVLLQQADKGTTAELGRHDHAGVQPGASIKHPAASLGRLQRRRNRPAFHVVGECSSVQAAKKTSRSSSSTMSAMQYKLTFKTFGSRAITQPSDSQAQSRLTSLIG